MKRSYDDERYIPWYRRPTPTWLDLSIEARGVLVSIAMELNDTTGEVTLRRGLLSVATLLRAPWEKVEPALMELFVAGKLEWNSETCILRDPEYVDRKRPTSKDRTRKYRDAKREDQEREEKRREEVTSPASQEGVVTDVTSQASPASPPDWFEGVLDLLEANVDPVRLPSAEAWLRYDGHRATKGIQPTAKDAQYWLTSVMIAERRKARDEAHHREKRDAEFDKRRAGAKDPPKPTQPTREQAQAFADELARRVTGDRKVGT